MAELYGRTGGAYKAPITADQCTLKWAGTTVSAAMQVQISYSQQVQRRRTIGNVEAAIWATYPTGQITIARMITTSAGDIFGLAGWDACKEPKDIILELKSCQGGTGGTYTAKSCIVTQYTISAESEGLTVADNIVIEFLNLDRAG